MPNVRKVMCKEMLSLAGRTGEHLASAKDADMEKEELEKTAPKERPDEAQSGKEALGVTKPDRRQLRRLPSPIRMRQGNAISTRSVEVSSFTQDRESNQPQFKKRALTVPIAKLTSALFSQRAQNTWRIVRVLPLLEWWRSATLTRERAKVDARTSTSIIEPSTLDLFISNPSTLSRACSRGEQDV